MTSENSDAAMKAYLREIGRTPLLTRHRKSSSQQRSELVIARRARS
jgi:hypothetical protein